MKTIERTPIEPKPAIQPSVSVRQHGDGRLVAILGERTVPVKLRQCFPWSEPARFISLRDSDDKEVALIEAPTALDADSRQAFELALAEAGFVLDVTRVLDIDEEIEIRQWTVETKQGSRLSPRFHQNGRRCHRSHRTLDHGRSSARTVSAPTTPGTLYRSGHPRAHDGSARRCQACRSVVGRRAHLT
jgi:hypothetical protein